MQGLYEAYAEECPPKICPKMIMAKMTQKKHATWTNGLFFNPMVTCSVKHLRSPCSSHQFRTRCGQLIEPASLAGEEIFNKCAKVVQHI
jgi:hypothetical protein